MQGPAHDGRLDADEAQLSGMAGDHAQQNGASGEHAHLNGSAEPAPPEPTEKRAAAAAVAHGLPKHLMPQHLMHTDSLVRTCGRHWALGFRPWGPQALQCRGHSCCLQQAACARHTDLQHMLALLMQPLLCSILVALGLLCSFLAAQALYCTSLQQGPSLAMQLMSWRGPAEGVHLYQASVCMVLLMFIKDVTAVWLDMLGYGVYV